jgi:hypothetical protein
MGPGAHPAAYSMGIWRCFPILMRQGREANQSCPSTAEIKNGWSNTSTPPVCLRGMHKDFNFFTELFVEDHNLFCMYTYVDLTEPISLTLIRYCKLKHLRHSISIRYPAKRPQTVGSPLRPYAVCLQEAYRTAHKLVKASPDSNLEGFLWLGITRSSN